MTSADKSKWLQDYLEESVANNLCTMMSCTTCGAMDFRRGLLRALAQSSGDRPGSGMDVPRAHAIVAALAGLTAPGKTGRHDEAIRLIMFDVWSTMGGRVAEPELSRTLAGSWAGSILEDMKEHHRAEEKRRRAHAEKNHPAFIEKAREEKRRAKQQNHLARLAAKSERDRLRRETKLSEDV